MVIYFMFEKIEKKIDLKGYKFEFGMKLIYEN
jgi:hypothetical protein